MRPSEPNPIAAGVLKCSHCGATLSPGALGGLCPACLLEQGAAHETGTRPAATSFEPPPVAEVARLFPQLEIISLIGRGGMGAVYKARQPALDRFVALKLLPAQTGTGPAFAERFNREARALARLNHPQIVAVHDFGQVRQAAGAGDGFYYVLMEFVDGVNLRQLQRNRRLSPREALQIVPQVCDALQYAHDEGVVHRDIKPENILLDRKGRVRIADFGLAKLLDAAPADTRLTGEGQVMGTPHYMAPEQIEHPRDVDHRADIFSLGVVFYELLTGELPLGKFPPPSSTGRGLQVDVRLDEVVLRALEKEPERRYQQAGEVKTAVEGIAGAAPPPSAAPELRAEPGGSYNYQTQTAILGWPLVHVAWGPDPTTGRQRVARGVVAVGPTAKGVVAVGLAAFGVLPLGLVAVGGAPVGILSLGLATTGLLSLALLTATGLVAIALYPYGAVRVDVLAGFTQQGGALTLTVAGGLTVLAAAAVWWFVRWLGRSANRTPTIPAAQGAVAGRTGKYRGSRASALALSVGVAVSCLVFLTAAVMTTIQEPVYQSTARIAVEKAMGGTAPSFGSPARTATPDPPIFDPYFIQNEFARLESSTLLTNVIEKLKLGERWGKRFGAGGPLRTSESLAVLQSQLELRQLRSNGLIEIQVSSADREEAAAIANAIVEIYRDSRPGLRVELVDQAEPGLRPLRPNAPLILAVGTGAGLLLGLLGGWFTLWLAKSRLPEPPARDPGSSPNRVALGLFLAGTLGTLVLMTLSPRHELALVFGGTSLVLAAVFAWRGRPDLATRRLIPTSPWLLLAGVFVAGGIGVACLQARHQALIAAAERARAASLAERTRLVAGAIRAAESKQGSASVALTNLDPAKAIKAIVDYGGFLTFNPEGRVTRVNLVYDEDAEGHRRECEAKGDGVTAWLPAFPDLTELLLHGNQATDRAMESVAQLPRLKALTLWWAQLSDVGVAKLAPLSELEKIHINGAGLGDASLTSLSRLPRLRELALQRNQFTDLGLAYLSRMPQLTHLWLGMGTGQITDAGLVHLARLTNLVVLDLRNYPLTDGGLASLRGLSSLRSLDLGESGVSPDGKAMLTAAIPGLEIQ